MESLGLAAPNKKPAQRAAFFYVPIGVVRRGFFPGEENGPIPKFTSNRQALGNGAQIPVGVHPLKLTPTMQPLAKVKDKVTLVTGLDRTFQPGTDVHAQCASCFLTSASAFTVTQSPYPQSRTLDHILAEQLGKDTPFRTLEFSSNSHKDNKESIHFDNISWYGTGHVAPSLRDPRKAYRRLFGTRELQTYRNITDLVLEDALLRFISAENADDFGFVLEDLTDELATDRSTATRDHYSFALKTCRNGCPIKSARLTSQEIIEIDHELEGLAGGTGSKRGSGGMASKLAAAKIAAWSGVPSVIADAGRQGVVIDAVAGKPGVGTVVRARQGRLGARRLWIAFAVGSSGQVAVDAGARRALEERRVSLLPAGVTGVDGKFEAGGAVEVVDSDGAVFAKGLVRHDAEQLRAILGCRTGELPEGIPHELSLIHI